MTKITVRFTDQQIVLLTQLLREGRYGQTMQELALSLLRDYAQQMLGRDYQQP